MVLFYPNSSELINAVTMLGLYSSTTVLCGLHNSYRILQHWKKFRDGSLDAYHFCRDCPTEPVLGSLDCKLSSCVV